MEGASFYTPFLICILHTPRKRVRLAVLQIPSNFTDWSAHHQQACKDNQPKSTENHPQLRVFPVGFECSCFKG